METFKVPETEQIQLQKKDGSMMVVSINNMITQNDLNKVEGTVPFTFLATICFGGKEEDYKDIPIMVLSNAVKYAQGKLGNPQKLTESKDG